MATFKAVVQKHQKRRDSRYPVSIRVIQNRKPLYISTGLYVSAGQINKKTFEIKDQFILEATNKMIREFEQRLLELGLVNLYNLDKDEMKHYLLQRRDEIDYIDYCHKLIEEDDKKWISLKSAMHIIEEEMDYKKLAASEFTASFIREFKRTMDVRGVRSKQKDGVVIRSGKMSLRTKENYLKSVCAAFRRLREDVNTEFVQVIKHDPFIGFEPYKKEVTKKRSMSVEILRQFFAITPRTARQRLTQDVMKMSFCLCGINVADLFALKHNDYDRVAGRINYERQKTKGTRWDRAMSSIRIEPEIADLVEKYMTDENGDDKLFRLGSYPTIGTLDRSLGNGCWEIAEQMGLDYHISPYWFRHTWATIARNDCDVSKDDIDLCLNHVGQNVMADVYIKPDWSRIDRANRKVLDYVFGSEKK